MLSVNTINSIKKFIEDHQDIKFAKARSSALDLDYYCLEKESNIKNYVNANRDNFTFSTKVLDLIDKTGKTDPEIYKEAGIDRRLFSKLRSNVDYNPSKETAIALCLALNLNINDAKNLLSLAGYNLSTSNTFDLVIMYFIEKENYNIMEVNEALDYFDCKLLTN